MARVSTYLTFSRDTEAAFNFYKSVFGTEFEDELFRMGDTPMPDGAPELSEEDKNLVMHVSLPILGGHVLMGTDAPESMGMNVTFGNNTHINLEPDDYAETERLFAGLSEGGTVDTPLQEMFWGAYYGSLTDKFGVKWMFNTATQTAE